MKTWGYLVRGGKIVVMKSFLYHILNNLIVDEYRKHKILSLDSLLEKGFVPKNNSTEHHTDAFDGKIALRLILRLPKKYQEILRMHYVRGLSLKEISLITGQRKNTISVQMHRGLAKLKILYGRK